MSNEWKDYNYHTFLSPGDEVKIVSHVQRNLANKVGVFERKLTKNLSVVVDGKTWRLPPGVIALYRKGDPSNIPVVEEKVVQCNPAGLSDCEVGDAALMYRGKFDIVEIVELSPKLRCKALDGRSKGKIFGYKAAWFVQKLDKLSGASV